MHNGDIATCKRSDSERWYGGRAVCKANPIPMSASLVDANKTHWPPKLCEWKHGTRASSNHVQYTTPRTTGPRCTNYDTSMHTSDTTTSHDSRVKSKCLLTEYFYSCTFTSAFQRGVWLEKIIVLFVFTLWFTKYYMTWNAVAIWCSRNATSRSWAIILCHDYDLASKGQVLRNKTIGL